MEHMDVDPIEFFDDECLDSFNHATMDDVGYCGGPGLGVHFGYSFPTPEMTMSNLACC